MPRASLGVPPIDVLSAATPDGLDFGALVCVRNKFLASIDALIALRDDRAACHAIGAAAGRLVRALKGGGRVFACGNGGSMCDAMHFAEELSGRFRGDRRPLPAAAISDPAHLTCVANDYGYEQVFARYLLAQAGKGDVLVAITTSGRSANILAALQTAASLDVERIALVGAPGSPAAINAEVTIAVGGFPFADPVQELHIQVLHLLVQMCEQALFPAQPERVRDPASSAPAAPAPR